MIFIKCQLYKYGLLKSKRTCKNSKIRNKNVALCERCVGALHVWKESLQKERKKAERYMNLINALNFQVRDWGGKRLFQNRRYLHNTFTYCETIKLLV